MNPRNILVAALAACVLSGLSAQVPQLISHQGRLLDDLGEPVPDATYTMEFRFHDACSGGRRLLTDTHVVETRNGLYSVLLGGGEISEGVESGIQGVFENHSLVCLGTKVGDDSEMSPRQQIASVGFALKAASTEVLGQVNVKKGNGVYYCDADWDDSGSSGDADDVISCLQSALGDLRGNEDGTDNALTAKLPDGYFDVSSACSGGTCFTLKSGIRIVGEMPRLKYHGWPAPDLDMEPNGGTWLDPGPQNTLFVGQHLRGVSLEKFGVANFGRIAVFGGDGENGIAFSTIRDIYGVGTRHDAQPRSADAFLLYNIQHLRMDHVKVYDVERGLYIIGQTMAWQPANSVISDFYVYTYPDPQGGIRLETIPTADSGDALMMNYVTFLRPQVNGFNSTGAPGTTGIWLKGHAPNRPVKHNWFIAADVEGEFEVAIRLENANHNWIEIAGLTAPTTGLSLDAGSILNVISSVYDRVSVQMAADGNNMFLGRFDSTDGEFWRGLYHDRLAHRWSVGLGPNGRLHSGSGFFWYDDAQNRWRVSDGAPSSPSAGHPVVTGTGGSATRGPALWADGGASCSAACLDAGMVECVTAWVGGSEVGCDELPARKICACR